MRVGRCECKERKFFGARFPTHKASISVWTRASTSSVARQSRRLRNELRLGGLARHDLIHRLITSQSGHIFGHKRNCFLFKRFQLNEIIRALTGEMAYWLSQLPSSIEQRYQDASTHRTVCPSLGDSSSSSSSSSSCIFDCGIGHQEVVVKKALEYDRSSSSKML
jgi:hypothetical protein